MLVLVAGDADVDVLARPERQRLVVLDAHAQGPDVMRERLDLRDPGHHRPQRRAAVDRLRVEVDQLDLEVGVGVGAAQQRPALGLLEVRQRERRVAIEVDVAVEQEGLARRALALLAPVHEHQPLPERGIEEGLVLVGLHLDADRLEPNGVLLAHSPPWRAMPAAERTARPPHTERPDLSGSPAPVGSSGQAVAPSGAGRPAGPPALYWAMCFSRSSGDIS